MSKKSLEQREKKQLCVKTGLKAGITRRECLLAAQACSRLQECGQYGASPYLSSHPSRFTTGV